MGRVGVTRKWRFAGLLLVILLLSATAQAEEFEAAPGRVSLAGGLVSGAQLDRGYSPMIFSGAQPGVEVAFFQHRESGERSYWLGYSSGAMQNRHGRSLESLTLSFLVATLYRLGDESPFYLGWSNDNQFNSRSIDGFLNFTGRSDYFTAFGPAAKYAQGFRLFGQEFSVDVFSHVQLLGFYLPSGYVSSLPRGFGYEPGGFFESFAGSVFLFHPGSAVSAGLRPELQWYWREGTSLAFSYSYEFVALRNVHTSRRSRGHFLLSLRMSL